MGMGHELFALVRALGEHCSERADINKLDPVLFMLGAQAEAIMTACEQGEDLPSLTPQQTIDIDAAFREVSGDGFDYYPSHPVWEE